MKNAKNYNKGFGVFLYLLCTLGSTFALSVGKQQSIDSIVNNKINTHKNVDVNKINNKNNNGKTPCQQKLEDDEKRRAALRKEMLDLFGMQYRPNPNLFGHLNRNTLSAKRFMYDLYKTSVTADCQQLQPEESNVTIKMVKDADTVVSFVNTNGKAAFKFIMVFQNISVLTKRHFNVPTTSSQRYGRCIDVVITLCVPEPGSAAHFSF